MSRPIRPILSNFGAENHWVNGIQRRSAGGPCLYNSDFVNIYIDNVLKSSSSDSLEQFQKELCK